MKPCLKRTVICRLYDAHGELLSQGRNTCSPPAGVCARMGIKAEQVGYDPAGCSSIHAEIDAIDKLPLDAIPLTAVVEGHTFCCDNCRTALRLAGVLLIEVADGDKRTVIHSDTGQVIRNYAIGQ